MKRINFNPEGFAFVDDEDFELLNKWKWQLLPHGYAVRGTHIGSAKDKTRKYKTIYMHRQVIDAPNGIQVDHINRNKLDNRKNNLRLATNQQNHQYQAITKKNTSGYKGVNYMKGKWKKKRWRAEIKANGKCMTVGVFDTVLEAAQAYNEAAKKYFGEFAYLNKL